MTIHAHPHELTFDQRRDLADLNDIIHGPADPAAIAAGTGAWPDPVARHGILGQVVDLLDPITEADPSAVYFALLAWAGCYIGPDRYARAGQVQHPGRIWPVITGPTADGAKGTAVSTAGYFANAVDERFMRINQVSGLSTSEGLITRVRDQRGDDPEDPKFDAGVLDKRLLVIEDEYASVLGKIRREGNTLSATVRQAYDGVPMQTLTSGNPMLATRHMITVIGQITPGELVAKMTGDDVGNGFANRFMFIASRRSKYIPDIGLAPDLGQLDGLANRFRALTTGAHARGELHHTPAARALWAEQYIARHEEQRRQPEGPLVSLAARWHANAVRLQVILATLDGADAIDDIHVAASLAAVDYAAATTRHVFAGEKADPELGKLTEFVDNCEDGVTRTQISTELFRNNKKKDEITGLIGKLLGLGHYREISRPMPIANSDRTRTVKKYIRVGRGTPQAD